MTAQAENAPHLLVFGASGAIGGAIAAKAAEKGWKVTRVARSAGPLVDLALDPLAAGFDAAALQARGPYQAVCWAQGVNRNDSVYDVDVDAHLEVYRANVLYILVTLRALLDGGMLQRGARLCVVSSIWQTLARQTKLSYCVSKAALQGLVLSAAADLAADGHVINAILPGALETPMTRHNLSEEQMRKLTGATGFGRLTSLEEVAALACFLLSAENTGVTGQFIAADLGYGHVRIV